MVHGRRGAKRPFRPFEKDEESSPADARNARDPYSAGPKYANSPEAGWVAEADAEYWKRQEGPPPGDDGQPPARDNRKSAADPHEEKYVQNHRTAPRTPPKPDGASQPRAGGSPMGYVYSDGTDYDADHDDGVQVVKPAPSAQAAPPHIRNPRTSNNAARPKQPPGSAGSQEPRPRTGGPRKPPSRGGKAGWVVLCLMVLAVGGGIYWAATQGIQMATDVADDVFVAIPKAVTEITPEAELAIGEMVDDLTGTVTDAVTGAVEDSGSIADAVVGMLPEAVGPYVLQINEDATIQPPEQSIGTAPPVDSQPQSPLDRTIWPTSPAAASPEPDTEPPFIEQVENHVHDMTNEERTSRGLRHLASDIRLDGIARNHSQDMADRNYFDHDTPEGRDPTDRGMAAGYNCRKDYGSYYTYGLAENIYSISWAGPNPETVARQIVDSWMTSPGHRQNILEPTYDALGVGIAVSRTGALYATQNFC